MGTALSSKEIPFTQEDRDRLIRLETKLEEMEKRIDQRFEQFDKRFSDLITFLWIIAGIFTATMVAAIGFAIWDRRSFIKRAKEETITEIEKEGRLKDVINALRELARTDNRVAEVLKKNLIFYKSLATY
ncbi:MAG: hypothetical protein P3W84_000845 [Thermodesulfobacteriaceae bacterium]|nr:hypothetical protein [Thermodesulfobacteriaceae bacterium]